MTQFLGIDIGTSRTKVILYDAATRDVLTRRSAPTPVLIGAAGDWRDPNDVIELVRELVRALAVQEPLTRVSGLAVTSVGEEIVLLGADGSSITVVPTWYSPDPQSTGIADQGHRITPGSSWFKFVTLGRKHDDPIANAESFTDLGSYVELRLLAAPATAAFMDASHASRTGLLRGSDLAFDPAKLAACGASRMRAPRLCPSASLVGTIDPAVAMDWLLPLGIPVVAGGHDHFCGAFAAGVREPGDVYISVGTSESQLMILSSDSSVPSDSLEFETGFHVDGRHRYIHCAQPSGLEFAEAVRRVGWTGSMDELYKELERVRIDPSPADARMREILELLSRQAISSAAATERLQSVAGHPVQRIVVSGSPAGQRLWRSLRAESSPFPLTFLNEPETSAVGAALLAQKGVTGTADHPRLD